jgi:hypothetical protein
MDANSWVTVVGGATNDSALIGGSTSLDPLGFIARYTAYNYV